MISFDEFKEYVLEHFKEALPEDKRNVELNINEVTKNNGTVLTGLTVRPEDSNIAPNIYLDGAYLDYEKGKSLSAIMKEMADIYMEHSNPSEAIDNIGETFRNFELVKDKIIMVAVGRERNAELLSNAPHTNREDLALIYKVLVHVDDETNGTITILNDHLDMWGVTLDDVHELAVKNTRELLPVKVQSTTDVMVEMLSKAGMPEEIIREMFSVSEDAAQYVITNNKNVNGAACIFYDNVLSELAERLGTDLYIFPSSIHECIAVSTNMGNVQDLAEMVADINRGQVAPDEQLSDHVYRFDAEAKTLKLADTTLEALGLDQDITMARPMRRGR